MDDRNDEDSLERRVELIKDNVRASTDLTDDAIANSQALIRRTRRSATKPIRQASVTDHRGDSPAGNG